jgi:hypothetical protein
VTLRPAFIFKQLSGDTYKNMMRSDNFYGRETGSVGGTSTVGKSEQLAWGVTVYRCGEEIGDWGKLSSEELRELY